MTANAWRRPGSWAAVVGLLGLLLWLTPVHFAAAATPALGVQSQQAAAQRDKSVSYFDLLLNAGETQALSVKLTNNTDAAITVGVKATTATTTDNGSIDYTGDANAGDKTIRAQLAEHVQGAKTVTVPANGSTTYTAKLTMPNTAFSGVMVGGLVFTPKNQATQKTSGKLGVVNRYAYTIAVLARNSEQILTPELAVGQIQAARVDNVNRLFAQVQNPTAGFANHVQAVTKITKPNGKVQTLRIKDMQMAPNSFMRQTLPLGTAVAAGRYQVHTAVYWGKQASGRYVADGTHYRFHTKAQKVVTVSAAKAGQMNHAAKAARGGMPTIYKGLIAIGIAIVVLLVVTIGVLLSRRKRKGARVEALEAELEALKKKRQ